MSAPVSRPNYRCACGRASLMRLCRVCRKPFRSSFEDERPTPAPSAEEARLLLELERVTRDGSARYHRTGCDCERHRVLDRLSALRAPGGGE